MHIELIENPLIVPTGEAQTTTLALHDHQRNSYAVRGSSVNDQTKSTEEQIRLLLSWRSVLGEIGSSELGAGQW
jgi:hypothetical protein